MQTSRSCLFTALLTAGSLSLPISGCERKAPAPSTPRPGAGAPTKSDGHDHKPGENHDHDHADEHGHGPTVQLGEQSAGGFTIKASRDGELKPGGDAPIDVRIAGGSAKVIAVRFWIGSQDAKGSVKAKAEIEKDNWHTHVEVPSPLPEGSALWVELESDAGAKIVASFDLKR